MSRQAIARDTIKRQTVNEMKTMGTYRVEYNRLIDLYAELWEQYARLMQEYRTDKSYAYSSHTADGGDKKSPLSVTIEGLRRDIMQCSDRLMLNPKARADPVKKKGKSKLAEALAGGP